MLLDQSIYNVALADSPKDFAEPATRILADDSAVVDRRCFTLVAHRLEGAEKHAGLMDGIALARGGAARRPESHGRFDPATAEEKKKAAQTRRRLETLATVSDPEMAGPGKIMGVLGTELKKLPDDTAARTVHAVGTRLARDGKWAEAREVFGLLATQYPGHPLAIEAFRWLVRYHASTEARRRTEIQQKLLLRSVTFDGTSQSGRIIAAGGTVRNTGGPRGSGRCIPPVQPRGDHAVAPVVPRPGAEAGGVRPGVFARPGGVVVLPRCPPATRQARRRRSTSSATTSRTRPARRRWHRGLTRGATASPPNCG